MRGGDVADDVAVAVVEVAEIVVGEETVVAAVVGVAVVTVVENQDILNKISLIVNLFFNIKNKLFTRPPKAKKI